MAYIPDDLWAWIILGNALVHVVLLKMVFSGITTISMPIEFDLFWTMWAMLFILHGLTWMPHPLSNFLWAALVIYMLNIAIIMKYKLSATVV